MTQSESGRTGSHAYMRLLVIPRLSGLGKVESRSTILTANGKSWTADGTRPG